MNIYKKIKKIKNIIQLSMLHNVYFVAHELLRFIHSHLAVLLMSFLFLVPFKPMSARTLHRDLAMKPLEPTSIGVQLAYHPFLYIFQEVPHIRTSFVHEPLLRVPPMGLSIPRSIFFKFCLKILVYLMMFGQYGLGTSVLSLNQRLVPRLFASGSAFGV